MTTETEDDQPTIGCRICGRRFVKSSLEKHEPACKKLTKMQRKVFDSGKQRARNSDIPLKDVRKAAMERDKIGGVFPRPQTHWRERHEEFMGVVNSSKQVGQALKTGAPLPPPPKTAINPDYIRCEFCGRSFNKNAADRHIEFCKEQSLRKGTMTGKRQNSSTSNSSRQKTASSTASSIRNGGVNLSATSKTPSSSSSSRGSRPGSAGPRRPSNGILINNNNQQQQPIQMMIGGAAVRGGLGSKLPQPTTKRSNSAPRGNSNNQQTMQTKSSSGSKSNFTTPKSAGNAPTATTMNKRGGGGGIAKSNSKQKL